MKNRVTPLSSRHSNVRTGTPKFAVTMLHRGISRQTVDSMLDAAAIGPGMQILDVCCGPAMLAAGALGRGADSGQGRFLGKSIRLASTLVPGGRFERMTHSAAVSGGVIRRGGLGLRVDACAEPQVGIDRGSSRAPPRWARRLVFGMRGYWVHLWCRLPTMILTPFSAERFVPRQSCRRI